MSDVVADFEGSRPLSQLERVVDTFIAPSRTFQDILRDSSWWLPWLLGALMTAGFASAVQQKVGWSKAYNTILLQSSAAQQDRMSQLPADQQASQKAMGTAFTKYAVWSSPILGLLLAAIQAGVLLLTLKVACGGQAKFAQLFAVWFYATLPWLIQGLLTIVVLFAGLDADAFNLKNPIGTNVGYFLPADSSKALIALGTALDVVTIWVLILLTIGCAIVAKVKRSSAAMVVWGWWLVVTVVKVVIAAVF
jgi:Yip1 domain